MNKNHLEDACTSILVGKNASIDGSTMIARNDDTFDPINPQNFVMHPAVEGETGRKVKSYLNKFECELPADNYKWPAVPNVDYKTLGYYDESGINGANVAMSATESTYGNERALAYDPLVKDGMDEDVIVRMVLPFVDSAKGAVQRTAGLIQQFGSPAGNSLLFSDKDDIWYMEIVTGHHWVAQRIPDDSYAVAANRVSIQQVDFNDPDQFMWSDGIQEFVEKYHLNTDKTGFDFRHIFGTTNLKDRHYNTSRVWYGHKYFNPEIEEDPEDGDLPFIMKTDHKINVEDIEYVLGSHYNETPYDPYSPDASDADKYRYRPIGLNRTQNSHVLQIRNDVPEEVAAIMWLCVGFPSFTPYVPFYTNMDETPESYREVAPKFEFKDAYWMYNALSMLVESHYSEFIQADTDYLTECKQDFRTAIAETDELAKDYTGNELTAFLTERNKKVVTHMEEKAHQLFGDLYTQGVRLSKLTFDMDKNL
ncbi:C69 family dipeptidase [Companilactobacillus ginsenosidimutans]|uniref:Dipeptidase n=1 Tax=Companilactobacillus ginsenosidimutans TaxID=1007676 RepID=A0A0H4QMM2_9LACO|nr:C69 family dipeptidase [Companilactobacillus ginsenosidimutans]AKP67948.1 peptidase C69 [Companilactobacillus ginsenosidimutans]